MATYKYEQQTLTGKKVVVTGGTTGIGRAIVLRLVSDGAHVLTFGREEAALQEALADIEPMAQSGGGKIYGMTADQSKLEDIKRVYEEADSKLGGLDVVINNAALAASSVAETSNEEMRSVIETNIIGYLASSHEAIQRMEKAGEGHIINIGSMSAQEKSAGSDIYVATKSAIRGFSESLRKQVQDKHIKVTLIEPGLVGSDMTAEKAPPPEQPGMIADEKMLTAEDLAESVRYVLTQPKRCAVITIQIQPIMSD